MTIVEVSQSLRQRLQTANLENLMNRFIVYLLVASLFSWLVGCGGGGKGRSGTHASNFNQNPAHTLQTVEQASDQLSVSINTLLTK